MLPEDILDRLRGSASEACTLLKVLSNEDRFLILCQLAKGEISVGELEALSGISQPTLSQQLGILREKSIVENKRVGKYVYYRVANKDVILIMGTLSKLYCDTVDTFKIYNHTGQFSTSAQISVEDIERLAAEGFQTIICLRAKEDIGVDKYRLLKITAEKFNIKFVYFPVAKGSVTDDQIRSFGELLKKIKGRTIAFCRGGSVSENLYSLCGDCSE